MEYMYLIAGVISGVIAGMGMGGGTILIPLLVVMLNVDMKVAQITNLLCFIPLAVFALIGLIKNKMVDFKYVFLLGIPAMITSVFASFLSASLPSEELKKYFGIFLIALGVVYVIKTLLNFFRQIVKYDK